MSISIGMEYSMIVLRPTLETANEKTVKMIAQTE